MVRKRDWRSAQTSLGYRQLTALGALLLAASGCAAALQANRRSPGVVSGDSFTVTLPPAASYGPGTLACPAGGLYQQVADSLADLAKRGNKPEIKGDGRLCAVAETLSGWSASSPPPESVTRQVAWHFGLPSAAPRVTTATFDTDDAGQMAGPLLETLAIFAKTAVAPRFGLQAELLPKSARVVQNRTRVVLVTLDDALDLDPVPRTLPVNGQTKVSGRLLGSAANATVLFSDPAGRLETVAQQGDAFSADLRCGERPGIMRVEIRAQKAEATTIMARFPIACGASLPPAAKIPPSRSAGPLDAAVQERKLFQLLNAERATGGAAPVAWDDAAGRVARGASENLRAQAAAPAPQFDLVGQLRKEDTSSPLVLQNPVVAPSAEEAHTLLLTSPVNRSNLLHSQATHGAVGVALGADPNGGSRLYVTELLIRLQSTVDTEALRSELRTAVAQKRVAAGVGALASDGILEEIAQKYANELVGTSGAIAKERESEIIAPLYKGYRSVNLISGAKPEPLDFADESGVLGAASLAGVGVAQGSSPVLGKNTIYVVIIVATKAARK